MNKLGRGSLSDDIIITLSKISNWSHCTGDSREKVSHIKKSNFIYNMKHSTETLSICIFVCLFEDLTDCI